MYIRRAWQNGDTAELAFDLTIRRICANPQVRSCVGKVALARGPILYCFEEADRQAPVCTLSLPSDAAITAFSPIPKLPEDLIGLRMTGKAKTAQKQLYSTTNAEKVSCEMIAIPFFAWANREKGDMTVWVSTLCEIFQDQQTTFV